MKSNALLAVVLAAIIVACQGSGAASGNAARAPATNRPLPEATCTAHDSQKLYTSVHQFVNAWNAHDGKKLDLCRYTHSVNSAVGPGIRWEPSAVRLASDRRGLPMSFSSAMSFALLYAVGRFLLDARRVCRSTIPVS